MFQAIVAVGILALVWLSFGANVLAPQNSGGIPQQLGYMELISTVEGPEAMAQVNKLHGTEINLVSAYIAEYGHQGEHATVWVGRAANSDAAAGLLEKMVQGIQRGGAGFTNLKQQTISGHEVFQVEGAGGKHFFYNPHESMEKVIWITIDSPNDMTLLDHAMKMF